MRREISPQRLFDLFEYLVDERVGVIRHLFEVKREAGTPDFFSFYARACDTNALSRQRNFPNAGGASVDRATAMAKALGEAVERYCAAIYEPEEFPFHSYESVPFQCVSPDRFALYSLAQYSEKDFPYLPFNEKTPVRWTTAVDLATEAVHYVPASMVYAPYFYDFNSSEVPIVQPISTGLACHCSFAEAAISGICEVIERDAFTIAWQARLGMPQIVIATLSERNREIIARFERTGASVVLLNITMDSNVPTILSILKNERHDAPALVFAASAHLDPEQAVRKSLEELALTRRLAQDLKIHMPPILPSANFHDVINQDCHVRLFCDQMNFSLVDFIVSSRERVEFGEIQTLSRDNPELDLKTLVEKIAAVHHQVLLSDVTTSDIAELGLVVVRVIIPGFHPLFFGHRLRALGGSRLWTIPQCLGYKGVSLQSGDNPVPHPYP